MKDALAGSSGGLVYSEIRGFSEKRPPKLSIAFHRVPFLHAAGHADTERAQDGEKAQQMEMLQQMARTISRFCDSFANVASVIGLGVSVVGFFYTIKSVVTAKKAAEQARAAAEEAKDKILKQATVATIATAIDAMDELIRLHRKGDWDNALDRHSNLRRILIEVRTGGTGLSSEQATAIQGVIEQFKTIEHITEKHRAEGKNPPNPAKLSGLVKEQIGKLHGIAIALKKSEDVL